MHKRTSQEYDRIKARIEEWALEDADAIADLCSELIQCETPSEPGDTRSAAEVVERFLQKASLPYEVLSQDETKVGISCSTGTWTSCQREASPVGAIRPGAAR